MKLRFRGELERLKKAVARTGLGGDWKELPNRVCQYFTDGGAVLNWHPRKGTIWFQGDVRAREEFEKKLEVAGKGRVEPRSRHSSESSAKEDIGASKKEEKLRRLSKRVRGLKKSLGDQIDNLDSQCQEFEKRINKLTVLVRCLRGDREAAA
jgi:hypothetical protein